MIRGRCKYVINNVKFLDFVKWSYAKGLVINNNDNTKTHREGKSMLSPLLNYFKYLERDQDQFPLEYILRTHNFLTREYARDSNTLVVATYCVGMHGPSENKDPRLDHLLQSLIVQLLVGFWRQLELADNADADDILQMVTRGNLDTLRDMFKMVLYAIGWWACSHQRSQNVMIIIDGLHFLEPLPRWYHIWWDLVQHIHMSNTKRDMFAFVRFKYLLLHAGMLENRPANMAPPGEEYIHVPSMPV